MSLAAALERVGLEPVITPLLEIRYRDPATLAARLDDSEGGARYDWLVCTSRHAVEAVAQASAELGVAPALLPVARVAAVGRTTASALAALGIAAAVVPATSGAAHLAEAIVAAGGGRGARALFPRAREARPELPAALRRHGVEVDDVVCYDTEEAPEGGRRLEEALRARHLAAVTLASGSAARAFHSLIAPVLRASVPLVSIGPATTAAAVAHGLVVSAEALEATVDALARAALPQALDSLSHA